MIDEIKQGSNVGLSWEWFTHDRLRRGCIQLGAYLDLEDPPYDETHNEK